MIAELIEPVYVYDPYKKTIKVGDLVKIDKSVYFYKEVDSRKHKMKIVDGYGIQKSTFNRLHIKGVLIKETDTGKVWESDYETWKEHGATKDFGSGKQIFLSLKYMTEK